MIVSFILDYFHRLVDEYNNTYRRSISKNLIDANYSALTEEIVTNPEALKFKVCDRVKKTKYKNVFSKSYTINWSRKIFIIGPMMKTNPWTYKIKDLNGAKIIKSFYENKLLLRNL